MQKPKLLYMLYHNENAVFATCQKKKNADIQYEKFNFKLLEVSRKAGLKKRIAR
jgi:hypothetical protein